MTLYVDKRAGSRELVAPLRRLKIPVEIGQYDSDVEFLGEGPDGPLPIGIEHKTISDCLTSLSDGRLTGTQIPRMLDVYGRVYLIIEGRTRVAHDGILEVELNSGRWVSAYGRTGNGWTCREFFGRLDSIAEFTGVRILMTPSLEDSAARIAGLYHWWQKDYDTHASWRAWDQSREQRPQNTLLPTSRLPLAHRAARELYNVGQDKAGQIAAHFGSVGNMALATAEDWSRVSWVEKIRSGPNRGGIKRKHMTKETIARIMDEIWATDTNTRALMEQKAERKMKRKGGR
jgi:ERCC4-type nuclease